MSAAVMMERTAEVSPHFKARAAGVVWLLTMVTGTFAMHVYGRLVVAVNPRDTVTNISSHEALFRTGLAAALIATACYIAATLLVYAVSKSVNRNVALLAAFFSLVAGASAAVSFACRLFPLIVLGGAQYLSVFTVEQLQALVVTFLGWSAQAGNISFAVFGLYCVLVAWLGLREGV